MNFYEKYNKKVYFIECNNKESFINKNRYERIKVIRRNVSVPSAIFNKTFAPHVITNPIKDLISGQDVTKVEIKSIEDLQSQKFVTSDFLNHYKFPKIQEGMEKDDNQIAYDLNQEGRDFFDQIAPSNNIGQFTVLVGRVGRGKSLFGSALVSKKYKAFCAQGYIPLRIEIQFKDSKVDKSIIFEKIFDSLVEVINEELKNDIDRIGVVSLKKLSDEKKEEIAHICRVHSSIMYSSSVNQKSDTLRSFLREIAILLRSENSDKTNLNSEQKFGFFVFLDGLDWYYYKHDKSQFVRDGNNAFNTDLIALTNILTDLKYFVAKEPDLKISVMVPLRKHVAKSLRIEKKGYEAGQRHEDNFYFLRLDAPKPNEVIVGRLKTFLRFYKIYRSPKESSRLRDNIEKLISNFENVSNQMSNLFELSNLGYRSLIDLLQWLSWVFRDDDSGVLIDRIFTQKSPLLLISMLNTYCWYSQKQTDFPNLFLVRGNAVDYREENNGTQIEHVHTYWLKFLMVEVIRCLKTGPANELDDESKNVFRNVYEKYKVDPVNLLKEFFSKQDVASFDEDLVGLCLGSLADENRYSVVEPKIRERAINSDDYTTVGFILTNRGHWLMQPREKGKRNCFSLVYLQLIIDDMHLEFPNIKCVTDDVFSKVCENSYKYISSDSNEEYRRGVERILIEKEIRIVTFLHILEQSLQYETRTKPNLFYSLQKIFGFSSPNFEEIRSDIHNSIISILGTNSEDKMRSLNEEYIEEIKGFYRSRD